MQGLFCKYGRNRYWWHNKLVLILSPRHLPWYWSSWGPETGGLLEYPRGRYSMRLGTTKSIRGFWWSLQKLKKITAPGKEWNWGKFMQEIVNALVKNAPPFQITWICAKHSIWTVSRGWTRCGPSPDFQCVQFRVENWSHWHIINGPSIILLWISWILTKEDPLHIWPT